MSWVTLLQGVARVSACNISACIMWMMTKAQSAISLDGSRGEACRHGLHGSASPVLTATGLVNGKGQFLTPLQIRHPWTDHQKICYGWLSRRPLQLCQIWCTSVHGGLLGGWVKYNWNFLKIYLYPFFANSPIGQTHRRIFAHDGSNDADSRKDVPF